MEQTQLKAAIEALIYASDQPVKIADIVEILKQNEDKIKLCFDEMVTYYSDPAKGIYLEKVLGGYQFRTKPDFSNYVLRLKNIQPQRLTKAALDSLAVIAYNQPITRAEIEKIRGVDSSGILKMLLEKSIIKIAGKKEDPGRPLLYKTTDYFLELVGLNSLDDLPKLKELEDGETK